MLFFRLFAIFTYTLWALLMLGALFRKGPKDLIPPPRNSSLQAWMQPTRAKRHTPLAIAHISAVPSSAHGLPRSAVVCQPRHDFRPGGSLARHPISAGECLFDVCMTHPIPHGPSHAARKPSERCSASITRKCIFVRTNHRQRH